MIKPLARSLLVLLLGSALILLARSDLTIAVCLLFSMVLGVAAAPSVIRWDARARRESDVASLDAKALQPNAAPEELSASALLAATMESMKEGVLVVDPAMRVVVANRAAQQLFNADSQGTFAARRLTDITRNREIHDAFHAALTRDERPVVKVETTGHERRTFDISVAPLRREDADDSPDARVQGAVGVFFDVTRLERLERIRQEFLSNVSHELRTPLTAILTFVETLESGAIDDKENNHRFLQIIRRNAARMHDLINDILELSAIEAGSVQVTPAPLRLHAVVADVHTALAARAAEHKIELRNEVSLDAIVRGDRNRLEQMLTNLVDNAVKFNREGGSVTVRHERDAARARDLILVSDTGEGIPPEHAERIFERFYRVDRARSRALGGTGLGLAIVKHLARAHGGEARVAPRADGSTFVLELPCDASASNIPAGVATPSSASAS